MNNSDESDHSNMEESNLLRIANERINDLEKTNEILMAKIEDLEKIFNKTIKLSDIGISESANINIVKNVNIKYNSKNRKARSKPRKTRSKCKSRDITYRRRKQLSRS